MGTDVTARCLYGKKKFQKTKLLPLDAVSLDADCQPRAEINQIVVDDYAASIASGAVLPPVVVFFDGVHYWLADGFHRWHSHRKAGRDKIACEVHNGTLEEARWFSYSVNQTHGVRRSNDDKAKAVKAALRHPNGVGKSDEQIAEHVGVDHKTVGRYRRELESTREIPKSSERTGKDGRTINVERIGRKQPAPRSEVETPAEPVNDVIPATITNIVAESVEPSTSTAAALVASPIDQPVTNTEAIPVAAEDFRAIWKRFFEQFKRMAETAKARGFTTKIDTFDTLIELHKTAGRRTLCVYWEPATGDLIGPKDGQTKYHTSGIEEALDAAVQFCNDSLKKLERKATKLKAPITATTVLAEPCPNCGSAERHTDDDGFVDCAKCHEPREIDGGAG